MDWWRARWRDELVPCAVITVAESDGAMRGFVTVDPATGYLDQIVVAPEAWGSPLARGAVSSTMAKRDRARAASIPFWVNQDNARAVRFYAKHGFVISGKTDAGISALFAPLVAQDELASLTRHNSMRKRSGSAGS